MQVVRKWCTRDAQSVRVVLAGNAQLSLRIVCEKYEESPN